MEMGRCRLLADPAHDHPRVNHVAERPQQRVGRWIGPHGLITTLETFEPVSGGKWRFSQKDEAGNSFGFHGTFHEMTLERMIQTFGRERRVVNVMLLDRTGTVQFSSGPLQPGDELNMESATCQVCHQYPAAERVASRVLPTRGGAILRTVVPIRNAPPCHECHDPKEAINGVLISDLDAGAIRAASDSDARWLVALAAGLTGLDTGSDIGASIRNPAHYCGVYGHKPTFGICSSQGQTLPPYIRESDIAVIGPLARSAKDLEIALKAIAGPDEIDGTGWQLNLRKAPKKSWRQWRVGVLLDAPNAEVDRSVQDRIQALAEFLGKRGARVSHTARPAIDLKQAHDTFFRLLRAATSRSLNDEAFARNLEAARKARSSPSASAMPMIATTLSLITVFTSSKSTFTLPGL